MAISASLSVISIGRLATSSESTAQESADSADAQARQSCRTVLMPVLHHSYGQQRTIEDAGSRNLPGVIDASQIDPRAFGLGKVAYGVGATLELLSIWRTLLHAAVKRGELTPVKIRQKDPVLCDGSRGIPDETKGAASDGPSGRRLKAERRWR